MKADRVAEYQEEVVRRRSLVREFAQGVPAIPVRPLVWELGCGHGHFLNAYAAAHPERLCIGVDLVAERVARAQATAGADVIFTMLNAALPGAMLAK